MEMYDFEGITVVPFATSGMSGMGDSSVNMQKPAKGSNVAEGRRFERSVTEKKLKDLAEEWL